MKNYCKIYISGSVKAPYDWVTSVPSDINRLCLINDGIGGYIVDNEKIPFEIGNLYFFPAKAHHVRTYSSYKTDNERVDHSYVNFELIPPLLTNKVICINPNDNPEYKLIIEVFKHLCLKSNEKNGYHNLDEIDQVYLRDTLLYLLNVIIDKEKCEQVNDMVIINALNIMHENLSNKINVSDIASMVNLSTEGFIRKFKKEIGVTPYNYLKKLKIRTAINMRNEGYSLNEIAEKCGYSDSSALLHAIANESK